MKLAGWIRPIVAALGGLVLTAAMVLDHLAIGAEIVSLAFGILFGGIVLALALAWVGLPRGMRELRKARR